MSEEPAFLSHVLWLGGPPDAGKTSVAELLAEWHGLQLYHFDQHEQSHMQRADETRKPALWAAKPDLLTPEQRWLTWPSHEMAFNTIEAWTERFEYACEDLLDMPKSPSIIAEGAGLFPDLVMMVAEDPRQAVFLLPAQEFSAASARRRGKPGTRDETTDPEQATENLVARDFLIGDYIADRADALGFTVIEIDGSRSIDDIAMELEEQWAPWLIAS